MSVTNKEVAALIIDFLSSSSSAVDEDYVDSLNVAVDCITEAFQIEKEEANSLLSSRFNGKKLPELLNTLPASAGITGEPVKVHIPIEDAEAKANAEELKIQGNKAMAAKNYTEAIEKYTAAIEISPSNAVYYSNRAAAYSSLKKYEDAVKDAESAIKVDPAYSKGYSRLGFAKYALNKPEEALDAYKRVLDIEGDKATDVMKRDYETAKRKVESSMNLEKSTPADNSSDGSATENAGAGLGGMPDLASMLGGGGLGGLGSLLNNPQVMQAAEKMMQNPNMMQEMMQNPAIKQMADQFSSGGGMPDFSQMMNDPNIKDMAKNMFGGSGGQP